MTARCKYAVLAAIALSVALVIGAPVLLWRSLKVDTGEMETELRTRLDSSGWRCEMRVTADRMLRSQSVVPKGAEIQQLKIWGSPIVEGLYGPSGMEGVGFLFGSADQHYGVLFFRPGASLGAALDTHVRQWGNGCWFFSDVPLRER